MGNSTNSSGVGSTSQPVAKSAIPQSSGNTFSNGKGSGGGSNGFFGGLENASQSGSDFNNYFGNYIHGGMSLADGGHVAHRASGGRVGPLTGATGGRADKLPMKVPDGSHVIPADVVSALGQGNSQHGHKVLERMFPNSSPRGKTRPAKPTSSLRKRGGEVPVMVSDGEFIVSPEDVAHRGGGDQEHGHRILDHFIVHTRNQNINNLKNLPGPARD
jgi:hypothetical protein